MRHLTLRVMLVVGTVVMLVVGLGGFVLSRGERSSACAWGAIASARLASYEWRQSAWRTPAAREDLVRTAEQLCLDRVYVDLTGAAVATGEERDRLSSDVAALVGLAGARGIEVGAVAGDPWWSTPEGEVDADSVVTFAALLERDGVALASLHMDVEPWGLEEWPDRKGELTVAYLEFVQHLEDQRARLDLAAPVVYLIPYWFDGSNGEAPLTSFGAQSLYPFDHLLNALRPGAAVSVMAYRDRALGVGGIVDLVRQETGQQRVPVIIGVETAPIDPPTATFSGADLPTLVEQLRLVADRTGTGEIVINDLPNLRRLAART